MYSWLRLALAFVVIVFFIPLSVGAQIILINTPPELSFSHDPLFLDNPVEPDTGSTGDTYTFRVRYRDIDGDEPEYVRVCFHLPGVISQECHALEIVTVDLDTGSAYEAEAQGTVLLTESGEYTYFFRAYDGRARQGSIAISWPAPDDRPQLVVEGVGGYSNVAFIPGFQGSRLYRQTSVGGEDTLWVPTRNQDAQQLFLDESGASIDPNIYSRDIIDRTKFFFPIYEDFISFMDDEMVGEDVIAEWRPLPYDWRLGVDEVAALPKMKEHIEELADSSRTGKVTIVAHSNGGLVAKLMLLNPNISTKVDRLILVATPQLGAPQALLGLLHGDKQAIGAGIILNKPTARSLGENMPGAHGLLPSAKYFDTVADPVISFTDEVKHHYDFRDLYGESVDTFNELFRFLSGDAGARKEPEDTDTDSPNVLPEPLIAHARDLHTTLLDSWVPPDGIDVIQIAGWGLSTIYAVEYDDCDFCPFGRSLSNLDRTVKETLVGDGTVLVPSALSQNIPKYFFDALGFNKTNFINISHSNILEASSLQQTLEKIIVNDLSVLPSYISRDEPEITPGDIRYHIRMKSPVAMHVHDSENRHTGLINNPDADSDITLLEEQIPNSSYFELGEKKIINLDQEDTYSIGITGTGVGTFTLEIDTVEGDVTANSIAYRNIPTTPALSGELTLSTDDPSPILRIDLEDDGETDAEIFPNSSLQPNISIGILRQAIELSDIRRSFKMVILLHLRVAERFLQHDRPQRATQVFRNLDRYIERITDRRYRGVSEESTLPLREMIAAIRETL